MKDTGIGKRLKNIEKAACKGQVGGRKNTMRVVRAMVREIESIRREHWWYRLEGFLFGGRA